VAGGKGLRGGPSLSMGVEVAGSAIPTLYPLKIISCASFWVGLCSEEKYRDSLAHSEGDIHQNVDTSGGGTETSGIGV